VHFDVVCVGWLLGAYPSESTSLTLQPQMPGVIFPTGELGHPEEALRPTVPAATTLVDHWNWSKITSESNWLSATSKIMRFRVMTSPGYYHFFNIYFKKKKKKKKKKRKGSPREWC